jgi:hypothetical protein
LVVVLVVSMATVGASRASSSRAAQVSSATTRRYVYPLRVSANGRYLVDQRNVPFMIVGDSPQAMIGNLSIRDAAAFIANRKAAGFNALWVNLLCVKYTGCRDDGTTLDGIEPFTTPGDLSTPNPTYFARADAIIRLAAKAGIVVFLDPIETGGWLGVLRSNGIAKDRAYGQFLGRRYRSFRNIVWLNGNDFRSWRNVSDDAVVLAVAKGIQGVDREHLQTVELIDPQSGSLDDPRWRSTIKLDAAYTYRATYAEVLRQYNRRPFLPVFMVEAGYEFEQDYASISKGDPPILRRQEYWSALSGAAGQFYGNHYTWQFADGWKDDLDTPGSVQLGYLVRLLAGRPWYRLVPDQRHKIVTAGFGSFTSTANVGSSEYVTTAATPDGKLAVSYLPNGGTIIVDTARLARPVQACWYDPTSGKYSAASSFSDPRSVHLTSPGKNADGDHDWVLVLTAHRAGRGPLSRMDTPGPPRSQTTPTTCTDAG